jgi:hypothetical protein
MQKRVGLLDFVATYTYSAAGVLLKNGVTLRAYGPPAPFRSFRKPQSCWIFLAVVWQTGDCSIADWQDGFIDDGYYYRIYKFIIPRLVP